MSPYDVAQHWRGERRGSPAEAARLVSGPIDLVARMEFYGAMVKGNGLSAGALAVAFVLLYRHLNNRTGRCDPSIPTLADETRLTTRGVQKAIAELVRSGWWQVVRGGGRGRTNAYAPRLDAVKGEQQFADSSPQRVNRSSPIWRQKGEQLGRKRVNRSSPEPVKNQYMVDLHRPVRRAEAKDGANDAFETFWQIYPSRHPHPNPRKPARLKFEAAVKRGADAADIIRGARNYAAYVAASISNPRHIAQAQTWLSQERWNDHQQPPEPPRLRVGMN